MASVWYTLEADTRRRVILALGEAAETNFELDFSRIGVLALADGSPAVRELAIELLWEDESPELMQILLTMAEGDEENTVRASAASALGRFVLLGEMEEVPLALLKQAQSLLLGLYNNPREDLEVRRRALEAVANSSLDAVEQAISEAYNSDELRMQVSAVFAMGRSADERWGSIVLEELESDEDELRYEAARAAGELELEEAVPMLARIAYDDDVEIRDVAIWALGEIGGRESLRVLRLLAEEAEANEEESLSIAIEDAIAAASLGGDNAFYLMSLDEPDSPRDPLA